MSKFKKITVVACVALAASILTPSTAFAAETPSLTVGGQMLNSSTVSNSGFVSTLSNPPAGTDEVTFILDGAYLGKDTTAPYTWNVTAETGSHTLKARSEGTTKVTTSADFRSQPSTTTPTTPSPTVTPTPTTTPQPSAGAIAVTNTTQLVSALKTAMPGTTISLADGTYTGKFIASSNGTASSPIKLVGTSKAVITTGSQSSGYAMNITGDYWNVKGVTVKNAAKGIVLDGSTGTVLDTVDVGFVGEEAVHFRKSSSGSKIVNSAVHDTGLVKPGYGEGIYIGSAHSNWATVMGSSASPDRSNNVVVQNNRIYNTSAEGIDVKEGTSNGSILNNIFTNAGFSGANYGDSWVDVKGNGYVIKGNTGSKTKLNAFEVHSADAPASTGTWGNSNSFSSNTVTGGVPGYLVNVQSGTSGNTVACQTTLAVKGVTNISCR